MKEIIIKVLSEPIVWSVLLTLLGFGIGWIVKKTKTTKDDEIYAKVLQFINASFIVAEKAIPDTSSTKWQKLNIALKDFNERYEARFGESAPAELIDKAKAEWAVLAAEIKKAKT